MYAFQSSGTQANPHALSALVKAAEQHEIVASRDIVDVRGIKLWAQGQPVSPALHHRLLERRLMRPLEVCLTAEDGLTPASLRRDLTDLLGSAHPLAPCLGPWASRLLAEVDGLRLHPVAQLMMTALLAARPAQRPHAIAGMALAGALVADRGGDVPAAMLGGLLHDIGEVYIHPNYLDHTHPLDLVGHKHLVIHPRVGQLLLSTLTDYPTALARAVGEHHERLDRSGYPARLHGEEVSVLGRALAVTELTLGVCRWPDAPLARASFALRVVPGEFDAGFASFVWEAARQAGDAALAQDLPPALYGQLAEIDRHMVEAQRLAAELREQGRTDQVIGVVSQATERLDRLRVAWNALGVWRVNEGGASPTEQFELRLAAVELAQRMRSIQRECLLVSDRLGEAEKFRLEPLWSRLSEF